MSQTLILVLLGILVNISQLEGHSICYGKYGCYSDDPPFDNVLKRLPESPVAIGTKFTLYTRKDYMTGHEVDDRDAMKLQLSDFRGTRPTKFIVHGYLESENYWWVKDMKIALLDKEDINLIVVHWGMGATFPYIKASSNCRVVGAQIAEFILFARTLTKNSAMDYHIIGFSLGGQIAGYAGNYLREKGHTLGRITALDAAGPYFEFEHTLVKLDPSDADFVDAIHTDSNTLGIIGMGNEERNGHIDFYPNGGHHQPGCHSIIKTLKQLLDQIWMIPAELYVCSHYRSIRYYLESINSHRCVMRGYKCGSWAEYKDGKCMTCEDGVCPIMGYGVEEFKNKSNGAFYFRTSADEPYCSSQYKVTFYTDTVLFGGHDDDVSVNIIGTRGQTGFIQVDHKNHDKGSVVSHVIASPRDIGTPLRIRVKKGGYLDQWYINKVTVQPGFPSGIGQFTACFKAWINPIYAYTERSFQGDNSPQC